MFSGIFQVNIARYQESGTEESLMKRSVLLLLLVALIACAICVDATAEITDSRTPKSVESQTPPPYWALIFFGLLALGALFLVFRGHSGGK